MDIKRRLLLLVLSGILLIVILFISGCGGRYEPGMKISRPEPIQYIFEYESSADFSQAGGAFANQTSEPSIYIHTLADEELILRSIVLPALDQDVRTDSVWLSINDNTNNLVDVFYKDITNNRVKYAGYVGANDTPFLYIRETPARRLKLSFFAVAAVDQGESYSRLLLRDEEGPANILDSYWYLTNDEYRGLGYTFAYIEAGEIRYNSQPIGHSTEDVNIFNNKVTLLNPSLHSPSDEFVISAPPESPSNKTEYTIEYEPSADFSQAGGIYSILTSARAYRIFSRTAEIIQIQDLNISTDQLWLWYNETNTEIFYRDRNDNKVKAINYNNYNERINVVFKQIAYTVEYDCCVDLSQAGVIYSTMTSEPTYYIYGSSNLELARPLLSTRQLWVWKDGTNREMFYKDLIDNKVKAINIINYNEEVTLIV